MRTIPIFFLRAYQGFLSPLLRQSAILPSSCRYQPTCSEYGVQVFRQYGLATGFMFLLKRVARCHPFAEGGYDPPPLPRDMRASAEHIHSLCEYS